MPAKHICPLEILVLFADEPTQGDGRKQAIDWAKGLELREGDQVWLPEAGWLTKDRVHH